MRDRNGRALVPRKRKLPWIPSNDQWRAFLDALREEPLRNQMMVLLAYEGALRSHELLALKKSDIDFVFQEITLRPKATRRQIGLTIPCPDYLLTMLIKYMDQERRLAEEDDLLFISESRSQAGQLLSYNEWATIVKRIAQRAGAPLFKTDTFRHLHLAQIAHAGVPLVNIVDFAGYRNARSAMLYFGLKMRDELTAMRLEFHC